ncbi:hypothetical protein XcvCFBP7112P_11540 [Xanthomonas citri pv. vignicola]|nr:hypothetical protein XcvCFBP7112P_11540 [Xanthomonas citri pv. vignicola]
MRYPFWNEKPAHWPVSFRLRIRQSPCGGPSSPLARDSSSKQTQQAFDIIYIMRNGLLTLLCALAAYHCWSLYRKRTEQ